MELFLDSSKPAEILEARSWGILSGVTTNPGLIPQAGPNMQKTLRAILEASPGPVFAQAVGWHDPAPLVGQARWLHAFSERIIVKLPMSVAGIQALLTLKQDLPELQVAITAVASAAGSAASSYESSRNPANSVSASGEPITYSGAAPYRRLASAAAVEAAVTTRSAGTGSPPRASSRASVARLTIDMFVPITYGMPRRSKAASASTAPGSNAPLKTSTPSRSSTSPRTPASLSRSSVEAGPAALGAVSARGSVMRGSSHTRPRPSAEERDARHRCRGILHHRNRDLVPVGSAPPRRRPTRESHDKQSAQALPGDLRRLG